MFDLISSIFGSCDSADSDSELMSVEIPSILSTVLWNALSVSSIMDLPSLILSCSSLILSNACSVAPLNASTVTAISSADVAELSASRLTSAATTANPLPESPALAAFTAAFSARRLV